MFTDIFRSVKADPSTVQPLIRVKPSWVLGAHTCNSSYSGGKNQENHSLKPTWANSLEDPILKKITKIELVK
jgi:hypothetical protein